MTPRENFIRFLKNEPYEWIPSSNDICRFCPAFLPDHVARGMVSQQNRYTGELGGPDILGVQWRYDPNARGSMEVGSLCEEIEQWEERLIFPDLDAMDWEGCAAENAEYLHTDKLIQTVIYTGFFERLISLVDFETAAVALIDEDQQETVHRLFAKLADFYVALIAKMKQHFGVELVTLHDDWGNQRNTMFSLDTHAEMIAPYVKKVVEGAHKLGVFVEMHSCGRTESMFPAMIELGVDTWMGQPINDKKMLVDNYGDRFKFCIDVRDDSVQGDEAVEAFFRRAMQNYAGKHIWFMLSRAFTPAQCKRIDEIIRTEGVVYPVA